MHSKALLTLTLSFLAACLAQGTGQATFYGGNLNGGTCSFSTYTLPSNIFGTALSGANWDSSANCGACLSVTGPNGNSITAMIVDQCPECPSNGLDLFQDAFAEIADPSQGVVSVNWEWIDCGISSPLQVHMKEGVSQWWFSAQVVNANKAIADLQVSTDGGRTWKGGLTRQDYNFFENSSGFGTSSVDVRVLSVDGDAVVVKNVAVTSGNLVTGSRNF